MRMPSLAITFYLLRVACGIRKVGGIYFWKLGRFGGSLYVARTVPRTFEWAGEEHAYDINMVVNRDR